jgi:two-component system response regulator (stage 0 sporulation protein F)
MSTFKTAAKGKVLIAEDNDDIRSIIAQLAEWEGWQVSQARNGQEALEKVVKERPNVLVLDHRMPGLTGGQVCNSLREYGIDVPVVLITAETSARQLAASLGIRYFLGKPFEVASLMTLIEVASAGG